MNIRRPSIIFAISAIVGIILAYNKILVIDKSIILLITFLLTIFLMYKKRLNLMIVLVCVAVMFIYFARYKDMAKYYDKIDNYIENNIGKNSVMEGVISNIGDSTNSSYFELSDFTHLGKNIGKIKCYYNKDEIMINPKIGNKVSVTGKMYRFEKASNFGQFDNQNYYRSLGFSGSMYANTITKIDDNYNKLLNWLYNVKCIIKKQVEKIFTKKSAGLFNCMITGDKSGIDKIQKKLFNENGIAHILAISGLHLSILGLGFFELLRKKFKLRTSAFIVSIFILLYGLFIDCSVASLRAIIMLYVRFLSLAIGRSYDSKNTLYILTIIFLYLNPYNLFNVGFQFSYMAILSLNMDYVIISRKLAYVKNEIKDWFSLSEVKIKKRKDEIVKIPNVIILTLFLFPITAYNYFTYPLYSILLNIIVIPLMSIVLFFGLFGVVCSFFSITFAKFVVGIVHMIFVLYEKLCLLVETFPYNKLIIGKPTFRSIILFYVVLLFIYFLLLYIKEIYEKKYMKEKMNIYATNFEEEYDKNNDDKNDDKNILNNFLENKILISFVCILLISLSMFFMIDKKRNGLEISCLSIGQGDSFVIKTKNKIYTIDGGSTSNTSNGQYILSPNLLANQITIIDKAYISHIDSDHTNAIMYVLENDENIIIKEMILPIIAKNNKEYMYLKNACKNNNVKISYLKRGDIDVLSDELYFECISPSDNEKSALFEDVNQSSLCLKLNYKYGEEKNKIFTMLFTGDMGKEMEKEILKDDIVKDKLNADILKVGHHGSRSATSKKFLEKVNPKYAVLSYGYKNSYKHPHKETMNALKAREGLEIYNTVDSGEIDIKVKNNIEICEYLK